MDQHTTRSENSRAAAVAALVLGGLFFAFALPLMLWSAREEYDEIVFHLPAVKKFAAEWPRFDFSSYTSATTPGFHLVLATFARFVSDDVRALRVVGSLFTAGLVATAGAAVARRTGAATGVALCLPLLCSPYVFRQGVWIIPQNAGWWGVAAVLAIALRPKLDRVTYVGGALALAGLVFVRQLHLWAAASLWLAAWFGSGRGSNDDTVSAAVESDGFSDRVRRAAAMLLATFPAFLIVGYFAWLWGGMVPKIYQQPGAADAAQSATGQTHVIAGGSPAAPAMVLCLTALLGAFFLPFAWPRLRESLRRDRRTMTILAAGAALGLLVGAAPETSYSFEAGRWSGIWNAVRRLPTFADRSPLVVALAAAGGAMLAAWFVALGRRDQWIFLGSWVAFTVTQCFTAVAWQRYYEPFLLMLFPLAVARLGDVGAEISPDASRQRSRVALAGPLVLALGLAGLTGITLRNAMGLGSHAPTTVPEAR